MGSKGEGECDLGEAEKENDVHGFFEEALDVVHGDECGRR